MRGLGEKRGEDGTFLLLEMIESIEREDVELGEYGMELALPLLLPPESLVLTEVEEEEEKLDGLKG